MGKQDDRNALTAQGVPESELSLRLVKIDDGDYVVVLGVRTIATLTAQDADRLRRWQGPLPTLRVDFKP